jgi:hypothetical protein
VNDLPGYRYLAVGVIVFMGSKSCPAFDISDVTDPPDAEVTYVGDVIQNGIPLQMKQLRADYPVQELLAYYKQRWADIHDHEDNVPPYMEKQVGPWWVLSKMEGACSVVIQVKETDAGGAQGFISVSDLSREKGVSALVEEFPRPESSQLVSSTESNDNGKYTVTLVITSDVSVEQGADYYRHEMLDLGWRIQRDDSTQEAVMLYFAKSGQQCEIALSRSENGNTILFANLMELPGDG